MVLSRKYIYYLKGNVFYSNAISKRVFGFKCHSARNLLVIYTTAGYYFASVNV